VRTLSAFESGSSVGMGCVGERRVRAEQLCCQAQQLLHPTQPIRYREETRYREREGERDSGRERQRGGGERQREREQLCRQPEKILHPRIVQGHQRPSRDLMDPSAPLKAEQPGRRALLPALEDPAPHNPSEREREGGREGGREKETGQLCCQP
jgi:hypothetical protein